MYIVVRFPMRHAIFAFGVILSAFLFTKLENHSLRQENHSLSSKVGDLDYQLTMTRVFLGKKNFIVAFDLDPEDFWDFRDLVFDQQHALKSFMDTWHNASPKARSAFHDWMTRRFLIQKPLCDPCFEEWADFDNYNDDD